MRSPIARTPVSVVTRTARLFGWILLIGSLVTSGFSGVVIADGDSLDLNPEPADESAAPSAVPQIQGSESTARFGDLSSSDSPPNSNWSLVPNGSSISTIATGSGMVVIGLQTVGEETSQVRAVDIETGTTQWSYNVSVGWGSIDDIAINQEMAFISANEKVHAVDLGTGDPEWQREFYSSPTLAAGAETVYAHHGSNHELSALAAGNGSIRWSQPISNASASAPELVLQDETVGVPTACSPGGESESVLCYTTVDRDNGEIGQQTITNLEATSDGIAGVVVRNGTAFLTVDHTITRQDAKAVAIDLASQSVIEFTSVKSGSSLAVTASRVFVTTEDGIAAINRDSTETVWTASGTSPTLVGGHVLTVVDDTVQAYDPQTGATRGNYTPSAGTPLASTISPHKGSLVVRSQGYPAKSAVYGFSAEPLRSPIQLSPRNPAVGTTVTLSTSVGGESASYAWDITGDGTPDAYGQTVAHTFRESGDHTISLTVQQDGSSETYTRSVLVSESVNATLTTSASYPLPGSFVTLNATGSSGTGTLQYEWTVNNESIYCSDPVCTIEVGQNTTDVAVTVIDAQGQTETVTRTLLPLEVFLEKRLDGIPTEEYTYGETILQEESLQLQVNDSQITSTATVTNVTIHGTGSIRDQDPITVTPTGVGMLTVSVDLAIPEVNGTVTRTVELTSVEFNRTDGRFTYEFNDGGESRAAKAVFGRLQTQIRSGRNRQTAAFAARQIGQRLDGLPAEIVIVAGDPDAEKFEDHSAYAVAPNKIVINPLGTQGTAFPYNAISQTMRHELTHLAQYKMEMETDGEWNFILEGHAMYEASTNTPYGISKPPQDSLLEWQGTSGEYQNAHAFVDAFIAEYGRQTFMELARDSTGMDFRTRFKQATGESFDSFYDRWLSGGSNDPAQRRGDIPPVSFYYEDGQLVATVTDGATPTWDVDGDSEDELTGQNVSWRPETTGEHEITLTLSTSETTLSQTQTIHVESANSSLPAVVAGSDNEISTSEALEAVQAWQAQEPVPGTERTLSTSQILEIVRYWQTNEPVGS